MVSIQNAAKMLPLGAGFGITNSDENIPGYKSWYDFLKQRLNLFKNIINENNIFEAAEIAKVIIIANEMKEDFDTVLPTPFLWDASERNVIVYNGKISGIVDEICFGDALFVLGLTYTALEVEGQDTLYTDYWADTLQLDSKAKKRLEFYRLFYIIGFMRKHLMTTANNQKIIFNAQRLKTIFNQSLSKIKIT